MHIPNVHAFSYHIDALHLHGETHRRLISEHRLFEIRCARSPMSARALAAQHATCRLGVYGVWISCCLAVIADGLELLEPWSLEYHPERIPFPDPWVPPLPHGGSSDESLQLTCPKEEAPGSLAYAQNPPPVFCTLLYADSCHRHQRLVLSWAQIYLIAKPPDTSAVSLTLV